MPSFTVRLRNDLAGPADALQVIFAPLRGAPRVRRVQPSSPQFLLQDRTLQAYFDEALEPGASVALELDYAGLEPQPVDVRFHAADAVQWRAAGQDVSRLNFVRQETDQAAIMAWRDERATAGPFTEFKRFFNSFDAATWSADPRFELQRKLVRMLRARRSGNEEELAAQRGSVTATELRPISAAFKSSLTPLPLHADRIPLHDAWDRFSRGELSMTTGQETPEDLAEYKGLACQPDSTLYFVLAELADAMVARKDANAALWEELLPTLVYTQQTFYETYADGSMKPMLHGAPLSGRPPKTPVPAAELRKRRRDVLASCKLSALWRANLENYVRF